MVKAALDVLILNVSWTVTVGMTSTPHSSVFAVNDAEVYEPGEGESSSLYWPFEPTGAWEDDLTVSLSLELAQCAADSDAVKFSEAAITVDGVHNDIVEDCNTLLESKSALTGTGTRAGGLNWHPTLHMLAWTGVRVAKVREAGVERWRVTKLVLGDETKRDSPQLLTGTIPAALGKLSALTVLDLRHNCGETPDEEDRRNNCPSGGSLSGAIPPELGKLSKLTTLDLHLNALSGAIPPELGDLSELTYLELGNNQLSGAIPAGVDNSNKPTGLAKLAKLQKLLLYKNSLSGAIPAGLGKLSALTYLDLHNNDLSGAIPAALGDLSELTFLALWLNQLSGAIPAVLGDLSKLRALLLYDNQLGRNPNTGQSEYGIPAALGKLSALTYLELENNQLTGPIPAELGKLSNLRELLLYSNQLTGAIPAELGDLSALASLRLHHNRLSGAIPPLSKLTKLQTLYLHHNRLSGPIPSLRTLSVLRELYLHGNTELTGPVTTAASAPSEWVCLPYGVALAPASATPPVSPTFFQCPTPALTSNPGADATYETGDAITATLTFNRPIRVDTAKGAPTLTLQIGTQKRPATYADTDTDFRTDVKDLAFTYTVVAGDMDADGIAIAADQVALNGALIQTDDSSLGTYLSTIVPVFHPALPAQPRHTVNRRTVPSNWSLIPKDGSNNPLFTAGQHFRLLFVTTGEPGAESSNIDEYNVFVQWHAAKIAALAGLSSQFRALGSTATVDARDNTGTAPAGSSYTTGEGVPIYWLGGAKVADDYADFYDGSWDSGAAKTGLGKDYTGRVWTGTKSDGTKPPNSYLGDGSNTVYGSPSTTGKEITDGSESELFDGGWSAYRLYALSPVITVTETTDNTDSRGNGNGNGGNGNGNGGNGNGDDTTPPALVAPTNLGVTAGDAQLNLRWTAPPGTVTGYDVHYKTAAAPDQRATLPTDPATGWVAVTRGGTIPSQAIPRLTNGTAYAVRVRAKNADVNGAWATSQGTPRAVQGGGGVNGGSDGGSSRGGGGGGGGRTASRDRHGNTPATASTVRLGAAAPWRSETAGEINTVRDRDYFTLTVPQAGILVVETTGATDTVGTVWQAGEELGTATSGGTRRNFRLRVPVAAGPVVIAVAGNRGQTGRYTLRTQLIVGFLENPAPASFQSGIGVISGWVCAAEAVEIALNGQRQPAAIGTARADTTPVCGHSATGFGLLFNWNLLGDGEHEVVAFVDDIELARATVTVTTLGAEIVEDAVGTCAVQGFPSVGETVTLQWQASSQNFVITEGAAPTAVIQAGAPGVGLLENPRANAYQSGIGLISGWVCDAERVEIVFNDGPPQEAGYGTARADTVPACGDSDNGFGLLFNWNLLGDGEHTVVAVVDGAELGRAVVRVTTLGEEVVEDAEGTCVVEDFPREGESVTVAWQASRQNFVIVAHEAATASP